MSSPDQVIISGKVHSPFQHNGVVGYRPIEPPMPVLDKVPLALWSGAPIPVSLWREVLAFFKWSYDTTKSETQVRLFYHFHRGEWRAHAFPQEKNSGMTTKELPDHPNMAADMKAILDDGFTVWGTVHHHCAAQAFQSGTDLSDEQGQAGIHITVGNMDKPEHSIHSRLTVLIPGELDGEGNMVRAAQKLQLEPDLYSWFGLSDDLVTSLPAELVPIVLRHYLITAARADETFPDRWKENVIEVKRVVAGFRGQATQHEFTHQLRLHPGRRYDPVLDYHVARMEREAERQAALDEAAQSNSYVSTAFDRWAAGDPV